MVGSLLVILAIAGFALHQYIKGNIISGFIFLIAALTGTAAAFGFYELLAGFVKDYGWIGAKAYPLAFLLLFLFAFAVIKEVARVILKPDISFGTMVDRAGGTLMGAIAGYICAGAVLITIGLTPYKMNWLYGRFEENVSNPPQANNALLNPDGFLTNIFGVLSNGSLKGSNSFAVVHTDYLNQIFLNRHLVGTEISPIAGDQAVSITAPGVRAAPENLLQAPRQKGDAPQPFEPQSGQTLTLVRLQINFGALAATESSEQPNFPLAQLRLILKDKQNAADVSSGSAQAVYPVGYLNAKGQLRLQPLTATFDDKELKGDKFDFAFYVPANSVPVLLEFRQNIIEAIGKTHAGQQPPAGEAAPTQAAPETNSPQ